jgi:hypothetical protein
MIIFDLSDWKETEYGPGELGGSEFGKGFGFGDADSIFAGTIKGIGHGEPDTYGRGIGIGFGSGDGDGRP